MRILRESILVWLALVGLYWVLRIPARPLELCYLDDSEILYHLLVILKGGVPYLDSSSHHFLGYLIPYLVTAKIFGFSSALVEQTALLTTPLVGVLVYLAARIFCRPYVALIAAALCISARQPFVLGNPLQYILNLPFMAALTAALYAVRSKKVWLIDISALCAGVALCFDQRALLIALIPLSAVIVSRRFSFAQIFSGIVCYCAPAAILITWIIYRGAWHEFYLQTFVFPTRYRVASLSIVEMFERWFDNHLILIDGAPILVILGLIGAYLAVRAIGRSGDPDIRASLLIFLVAALFCISMPISSGRIFDYYTIAWLPWLGLASAVGLSLINFSTFGTKVYAAIMLSPVAISVIHVAFYKPSPSVTSCAYDGANQVVSYLASRNPNDHDLLVWGYRLDLYVKLGLLGPTPDANPIMINPDRAVLGESERKRHVLPEHEQRFLQLLALNPPRFIVIPKDYDATQTSVADNTLRTLVETSYSERLSLSRKGFMGAKLDWKVFERNGDKN